MIQEFVWNISILFLTVCLYSKCYIFNREKSDIFCMVALCLLFLSYCTDSLLDFIMKNIKYLLAALLLLIVVRGTASDNIALVLEMLDGRTFSLLLAEKPTVTFTNGNIKIVSECCIVEVPRKNVRKYHFSKQPPTSVAVVHEAEVALENNVLVVSDVPENTQITIYAMDGRLVKMITAIGGNCSISLNELSAGLYLVSFNNTTFKFMKK